MPCWTTSFALRVSASSGLADGGAPAGDEASGIDPEGAPEDWFPAWAQAAHTKTRMGKNGFIPTVRVIACNQNCSVFSRLSACGVTAPTQLGCRNTTKCKLALLLFVACGFIG